MKEKLDPEKMSLFTGNSNPNLAQEISSALKRPLGSAVVKTFSDGEIQVEIHESVRGQEVFIIQSLCKHDNGSVNDSLMELLILIDALKRASAEHITAIIPYYGYARQDRKVAPRAPISAKLVADMITGAGAYRVASVDIHSGQIQGFFNIFDHIFSTPVVVPVLQKMYKGNEIVVISPDAGGVERARFFAKRLNASLAIIDKRRDAPNDGKSITMNIIGDVAGLIALLMDDIVDTAGTLARAALALKEKGAKAVVAFCTHGVFSGSAVKTIEQSPIEKVIVTDTIPLSEKAKSCSKIATPIQIAPLIAEVIEEIFQDGSVSSLFK